MKFAARILFGPVSSFGLAVYLFASLIFGEKFNTHIALFSVFCAHFPNLDMIPFALLKKYTTRRSHWVFGHHFLPFIPTAIGAAYFAGEKLGLNPNYLATIAGAGVFLHFLHNAMEPQGLHWLSPFKWYPHIAIEWTLKKRPRLIYRDKEWVDRFFADHVKRTGGFSGREEFSDRASELEEHHVAAFAILCFLNVNFALTIW